MRKIEVILQLLAGMVFIRANPGLLILHEGTILTKWHTNDIPEYKVIKTIYLQN